MRWIVPVVLAASDALATLAAGAFAVAWRAGVAPQALSWDAFAPVRNYASLAPSVGLLLLARGAFGLYPGYGLNAAEELRRQTWSSALVVAAFATLAVAFRFGQDYSRFVLAAVSVWVVLGLPILRTGMKHLLAKAPWYGIPMFVLGASERTNELAALLEAGPVLGIRPVLVGTDVSKVRAGSAKHVLIVSEGLAGRRLTEVLDALTPRFPNVWLVPDLLDVTSAWVTAHDLRGHLALKLRNNLLEPDKRLLKRLSEVCVLVLAGPLALLALGVIAILVRLDSRGPVFFVHKRIGKGGGAFGLVKFGRCTRIPMHD